MKSHNIIPANITRHTVDALRQLYLKLASHKQSKQTFEVNTIFLKYSSVTINGKDYRSSEKRQHPLVVQLVSWNTSLLGDFPTPLQRYSSDCSEKRPVNVNYFMKVSVTTGICT